jgi:hypothetical protein
MRLNLGCGSRVVQGWTNVDYAVGARLANIPFFRTINRRLRLFQIDWDPRIVPADLRKSFPWPEGVADAIYVSHLLEHFTRTEGLTFLKRCHGTLKRGGVIRVVAPDLRYLVEGYSSGGFRADEFVERIGVLPHPTGHPLKDRLAPCIQFPHKCMYDAPSLLSALRATGIQAEEKQPFESSLPDIGDLELRSRTEHAVIVEGKKS